MWVLPSLKGQREALEKITRREELLTRLLSGEVASISIQAPKANGAERTVRIRSISNPK